MRSRTYAGATLKGLAFGPASFAFLNCERQRLFSYFRLGGLYGVEDEIVRARLLPDHALVLIPHRVGVVRVEDRADENAQP